MIFPNNIATQAGELKIYSPEHWVGKIKTVQLDHHHGPDQPKCVVVAVNRGFPVNYVDPYLRRGALGAGVEREEHALKLIDEPGTEFFSRELYNMMEIATRKRDCVHYDLKKSELTAREIVLEEAEKFYQQMGHGADILYYDASPRLLPGTIIGMFVQDADFKIFKQKWSSRPHDDYAALVCRAPDRSLKPFILHTK